MNSPRKPLLVGEANPYGIDPAYALYPLPERASGHRLCTLVMGLEIRDYLRRFDRVNLCPQRWSEPVAREQAARIRADRGIWDHIVLLGAKVSRAFGEDYKPFTWSQKAWPESGRAHTVVVLPHPSGLCRAWNEPGAFEKAREVLRCSGVLA